MNKKQFNTFARILHLELDKQGYLYDLDPDVDYVEMIRIDKLVGLIKEVLIREEVLHDD